MRIQVVALSALASVLLSAPTHAQEIEATAEAPWSKLGAFDRDFALSVYGMGWAGSYAAGGIGFRARWEPFDRLGVEVYSDHLRVEDAEAFRHDHPIGFNLYVPIRLSEHWRIRPLFGFCTVFSIAHPNQDGVDRLDDVHFGVHAGGGVEYGIGRFVSLFLDVQGTVYVGHGRSWGGWQPRLDDQVGFWGVAEAKLGVQVHL